MMINGWCEFLLTNDHNNYVVYYSYARKEHIPP